MTTYDFNLLCTRTPLELLARGRQDHRAAIDLCTAAVAARQRGLEAAVADLERAHRESDAFEQWVSDHKLELPELPSDLA